MIWFLPPGDSEVQRLKAELEARGERFNLEALGLALERFRLATGGLPATLEPLVPNYLESVPMDPFEGNPIHYQALPNARFALWAQDASGQPQSYPGNPLTWPAADTLLPFAEPPSVEVETQNDE